jgi:hypothetical protein
MRYKNPITAYTASHMNAEEDKYERPANSRSPGSPKRNGIQT